MTPQDTIWRVIERLEDEARLIVESRDGLDAKQHADLLDALAECEQLHRRQIRLMQRVRRRYPD